MPALVTARDVRATVSGMALALSWLGFLVHNAADLPARALIGPETIGPTLVYVVLAVARHPRLLLAWAWIQLLGGAVLSVLPLPFLPYDPDQTVSHYAFHALYGAAQIPLIVRLTRTA